MDFAERIPHRHFFVGVASVTVLDCIFYNFADLLFKDVVLFYLHRCRLHDEQRKVSNLPKIGREHFLYHVGSVKERIRTVDAERCIIASHVMLHRQCEAPSARLPRMERWGGNRRLALTFR